MTVMISPLSGQALVAHTRRCREIEGELVELAKAEMGEATELASERGSMDPLKGPLGRALGRVARLSLERDVWRRQEVLQELDPRKWDPSHFAWNPHEPIPGAEDPKPLLHFASSIDGEYELLRANLVGLHDVDPQMLLELCLAVAVTRVFRQATIAANELSPRQAQYLLFGNRRVHDVIMTIWRKLVVHHGQSWHQFNAEDLPRRGRPVHELLDGMLGLSWPTARWDLPLFHPVNGRMLNPLSGLGHNYRGDANLVIDAIRQDISPDVAATFYAHTYHSAPAPPVPSPS